MTDSTIQFELTDPVWLATLAALPVAAYYFVRSLVDFARWQRITSLAVRLAILLLLALSLAGLTLIRPTHEQYVVFAIDRSLSVGDESQKEVDEFIKQALLAQGANRAAFIPFAAEPGLVGDRPLEGSAAVNREGTNLAAVIEAAAASAPPSYVPRIVLATDGNQTDGDAVRAALRAETPIDTVALKTRSDPEVQVSQVSVPAQVREGEPFYVDVVIDGNHDDEGLIEVYRGAHKVIGERRKLKKGENRLRFQQSIVDERLAQYTVRVSGLKQDTLLDNNAESGLVFTAGKPRVLLIESDPKLGQHFAWAMEQEEIQVDVRPPQGMPDGLADLQNYELVILSNVPATALTQRQMEIARTYVQDLGGGLMMLGGEQSFGLGGYYKTVLEEILPVRSDFEKEKEKPSLAMALVIDKSGSMGGEKIELAKEAAKSAAELLGGSDKLGVIAFEGEAYWISEMQSASNKGRIIDDISRLEAGGGTNMYPAMDEAFAALQATVAKLKHVIILSDGISAPGDFEGIANDMATSRITISTVGVGEGADEQLLEEIARIGQGRYYFTDDPTSIPQIFAKETVTASKSAIDEQPFLPQVVRPSQALADIDFEAAPFLLGYVMTRVKPTSELILASEKGDPLLAWWRYGLGMTVAFTSDAKSRWAAEWLSWPGYGKFWAQVVRHAMRKSETKGVLVEVKQQGRRATVTVDAVDPAGRYLNQAETELTVIDPQLRNRKLPMTQTAPGRYMTQFDTPQPGAYHLELAPKSQGTVAYRQSRGLMVGYSDELRLRPTNEALLKSLAQVTGGAYAPAPAKVFAETDRTAQRTTPLWPYLLMAAASLLVIDVALRRIDFNLLGSWLQSEKLPTVAPPPTVVATANGEVEDVRENRKFRYKILG
ncbi:MAG TPA: FixH family protein [Pirellulales bacterium]|nr:FixH family protein [Pirellulales bacterium]